MARPLRIQYPGAFYHITCRGNEQKDIFMNDNDRTKFLRFLQDLPSHTLCPQEASRGETRFKGFELAKKHYEVKSFICSNECEINTLSSVKI